MRKTSLLNYKCYKVARIKGDSLTIARIFPMPALATHKERQQFDYSTLDPQTSQFVQQQTGEIRALMKRTAQDIIEVGQKLTQVKKQLGHGRFRDWLHAEFEWSVSAATRFMQVSERFQFVNLANLDLAPSALYELAAPATPESARVEAIARAKTGESITHKAAKTIKQKYATSSIKPKIEPQSEEASQRHEPTPTKAPLVPQSSPKQQIVAILPPKHTLPGTEATNVLLSQPGAVIQGIQPKPPVSAPNVPGEWWQLGGKHLLYCGDPNSLEFLERIPEQVSLLFAFPPISGWLPAISAKTYIVSSEYLPQGKNPDQFDEFLESNVLFNSNLKDTVVCCFLPVPDIVIVISRLARIGLLAEPDARRCNAVITDWKKAGVKVERIS